MKPPPYMRGTRDGLEVSYAPIGSPRWRARMWAIGWPKAEVRDFARTARDVTKGIHPRPRVFVECSEAELPDDLVKAIEAGELTADQVRRLAEFEARALGLSLSEAIEKAQRRELPRNAIGMDLEMLVGAYLATDGHHAV